MCLAVSGALFAQDTNDRIPVPIIDNERVTVWYPAPVLTGRPNDAVVISVAEGLPATVNAYFHPAGSMEKVTGGAIEIGIGAVISQGQAINPQVTADTDAASAKSLRVEIKAAGHIDPLPNASGYPEAFPRPGSFRMLNNDVVTVWDYRWTVNEPTPMHFHTKDVVVMFLEDGTLVSTTPDGTETANQHYSGEVKFNRADRVHTETLTTRNQRAIIIELK